MSLFVASAKVTIDQMQKKGSDKAAVTELRLQKILIHNGIGIYATWTTVASLLNLNIAFQYIGRYDAEITSLVCCSVLLSILVVWFVLENTVFDQYVRYLVAQYPGNNNYSTFSNLTYHSRKQLGAAYIVGLNNNNSSC